ncbi:type I phosphomannose isomerase catalytic subunit [Pectinatus brassicae]|uniref:Phosphohexomutase n=1 Tax=Pectinatus brassicae TaxID=862415 RepID=A0A840UGC1_9FIRM|nr:type I phosphomannose isomerase catalytic subunit [Pectinatus brassicae]MBB5336166.1 mannose-6-phosphate isomerase [Pectinatus brassicae]
MLYPLKLQSPLKDYIWGSTRLKNEFSKETDLSIVAESWELACHKAGTNIIENGEYQGQLLSSFFAKEGKNAIGTKAAAIDYFPLLIKLIDAHDNLSVQVHPDDAYAQLTEGEPGKTEMWYIVDAEPDAKLIYGFKNKISREEFEKRITDNTLLEVCNQEPVKKGDVFFINSGTLHAIGKGILIAEIQQNSNTTYRVYDYGRIGKDGKPRDLHIAKALTVTNLDVPTHKTGAIAAIDTLSDYKMKVLAQCDLFTVIHFDLAGNCSLCADETSFHSILVLDGEICLNCASDSMILQKGDSIFIPANMQDYRINGTGEFILTTL